MNSRQKELEQRFLDEEKETLKKLKENYQAALDKINLKIAELKGREDADMQHVIYQIEYQKALKTQVQAILDQLQNSNFETVSEYLTQAYEQGFIGTLYDLQGQGIPLIMPIDQRQAVVAIRHETQLSEDLYTALGKDTRELSRQIASEITRGIATASGYAEIARNIQNRARIGLNNSMRIARTEAHRIQNKAISDAQWHAKSRGADIVKIWSAALDGRTRYTHRKLDGQIRELDEPFEVDGMKAMEPGDFGRPEEDCNCRCRNNSKARWLLDAESTKHLGNAEKMTDDDLSPIADKLGISVNELRKYKDQIIPVNAKNYADFRRQYEKIINHDQIERVRSDVQKMKIGFPEDVFKIKGFTEEVKNEVDKAMKKLETEYDIRLNSIVVEPAGKGDIFVTGYHDGVVDMVVNENADFENIINNIPRKYNNGYMAGKSLEDYVAHEMAHCMLYQDCTSDAQYKAKYQQIESLYDVLKGISGYADNAKEGIKGNEALAEAFVRVRNNEEVSPIVKVLVEAYFGKWRK